MVLQAEVHNTSFGGDRMQAKGNVSYFSSLSLEIEASVSHTKLGQGGKGCDVRKIEDSACFFLANQTRHEMDMDIDTSAIP